MTTNEPVSVLATEYDATLRQVIQAAEECPDGDWQVRSEPEGRTVGVLFDHIAAGNDQVVEWIVSFLGDRAVEVSPQLIDARNAVHLQEASALPRDSTLQRLRESTERTSRYLHGLQPEQLSASQEFGWLGAQDVTFLVRQAIRHPQRHLQSIRAALGREAAARPEG